MTYLVDTNVLSELSRTAPDRTVAAWMKSVPLPETYLSVVTLAEIRRGITVARDPIRQQKLESWLAGIRASYQDRVLPVDETIAELAGTLEGICQLVGRPAEPFDALIAATAQHHALTVVTRNVTDFEVWGGPVFNPWTGT